MDTATLSRVTESLPLVSIVTVAVLALVVLSQTASQRQLEKIPLIGREFGNETKRRQEFLKSGARKLYQEGYQKFKNSIYRITTSEDLPTIVVGKKYLEELRRLPDDVLNFPKAVDELMYTKYTGLVTDEPIVAHTVRADLTPALTRVNPRIQAEVEDAFAKELPQCTDWTKVHIYSKLLRIVARVSGQLFVGAPLCHDEEYIQCGVNYTVDLVAAANAVKKLRPWLRPFLSSRLPEVRALREWEKKAHDLLAPVVQARLNAEKNDPNYQKPDDMLQWFMNRGNDYGVVSVRHIARVQLGIIFAAIHTTSLTTTHGFYSLSADPAKYTTPLRNEIRSVLARHAGTFSTKALQEMELLDSFMKEGMRLYPPGLTSFTRKVVQPFTLSNGQSIPAGAMIEVQSVNIGSDPEIWGSESDPEKFDGFRFYNLRKAADENGEGGFSAARNQFVSINQNVLGFGYGRHACPGRFFAGNEIKMILAHAILNYDIQNAEGVEGRYPNIEFGKSIMPDVRKDLLFKRAEA